MSKRSSNITSTPKKKKPKFDPDQQATLDKFFASPPSGASSSGRKSANTALTRRSINHAAAATAPEPEVIDVDALEEQTSVNTLLLASSATTTADGIPPPVVHSTSLSTSSPSSSRLVSGSFGPSSSSVGPGFAPATAQDHSVLLDLGQPLSTDPPFFDIERPPWRPGHPAPYAFLARALSALTETKSRIAITHIITNTLRLLLKFHPPSLLPALYLLSNTFSPAYSPTELGLGASTLNKAIQHVSGLPPAALRRLWHAHGDPGDVAFAAKSTVRTLRPHAPLLITGVYDALLAIAYARGQGAARQKQAVVEKLLIAAKGEEVRFLARTLAMNLRVGAVRTTLLTALARAVVLTPPVPIAPEGSSSSSSVQDLLGRVVPLAENSKKGKGKKEEVDPARVELWERFARAESLMKKTFVRHPNYAVIVDALREVGLDGLAERVPLTIGVPLHPTLGSPMRSLDEVYERLNDLPFAVEFKYDGQRAQIHACRQKGQIAVSIFSRHLENMTDKYPDIVRLIDRIYAASSETESFIIDSEIVAVDARDGSLRSFQELSNRARKDVNAADITVSVCVYAFDLMYLNGKVLLAEPFRKRRDLLRAQLPPLSPPLLTEEGGVVAKWDHVRSCESSEGRDAVEAFWQEAVDSQCEGLMIKLLDNGEVDDPETANLKQPGKSRRKSLPATYEPDKRTSAWLKLKKDYVAGLGDSLDLVPVGAWHGIGRKAQWWSPILLAIWDADQGRLVAVCKCMSGFTDAFYKALHERYPPNSETCSSQPLWECEVGGLRPAVFFKPSEVWEIRGADVTVSPVSPAARGKVSSERGLSLRFPRFIRVRDDKKIEEASDPDFLAHIYQQQRDRGTNAKGADEGDLVDVEFDESVDEDECDE